MKDTWRQLFRRLSAGCIVFGSLAWSSAICYAVQLAYDNASDPVYADGWQGRVVNAAGTAVIPTGDNGGFGFTQWNFTSLLTFQGQRYDYANTDFHAIDDGLKAGTHYSNPHNDIGRAWDLGDSFTAPVGNPPKDPSGVPRAGRGFSLPVGDTLKVVFDNPTKRQFFRGYQINLRGGSGGVDGNFCYGGEVCVAGSGSMPKTGLGTFEYFSYGGWTLNDASTPPESPGCQYPCNALIPVFDTDTAAAGAVFTIKRTGTESYEATLDSLSPLKADFGPVSRTFNSAGAEIDWIEFSFFNGTTDLTPTLSEPGTDFYIRSMEITGPAPPGVPGDYNNNGQVDAADYVLWRKGGPLQNEVDTPGTVNAADYTEWRARFGNTSGSGSQVLGATVPESSTFVYSVTTLGMAIAIPRGKRNNTIDG